MHACHASITPRPRESQHRHSGARLSCNTYNIIVQLSLPRVTETRAVRHHEMGNESEDDHQAGIHHEHRGHITEARTTNLWVRPSSFSHSASLHFSPGRMGLADGRGNLEKENRPLLEGPERDTLSSLPFPAYLLLSCNSDRRLFSSPLFFFFLILNFI